MQKIIPKVTSRLRHNILCMPEEIREASGIVINGRRIKSLVFSTDIAIVRNCDADAVFSGYPFPPPSRASAMPSSSIAPALYSAASAEASLTA